MSSSVKPSTAFWVIAIIATLMEFDGSCGMYMYDGARQHLKSDSGKLWRWDLQKFS